MSEQETNKKLGNQNLNSNETVEVLYQKLGNRWYAFSAVDEDVFVGAIDLDAVVDTKNVKLEKITSGNS